MSRLFLSYRRSDCPDTVKLLYERLKVRLPRWQIFYDHQSIQPGEVFPERLRHEVTTSEVVFVLIGPQWLRLLQERRTSPRKSIETIKRALHSKRPTHQRPRQRRHHPRLERHHRPVDRRETQSMPNPLLLTSPDGK